LAVNFRPFVTYNSKLDYPTSRQALAIGMWLFLAALTMLFAAGMMLYLFFYFHVFGNVALVPVHLPPLTWVSTAVLLASSVAIHRAVCAVRIERQAKMRRWLYVTSALAIIFVLIQAPCMAVLWHGYRLAVVPAMAQTTGLVKSVPLDGFVAVLIGLHAAHVIGGVVAMIVVTYHAHHGKYDHEQYMAVRHAALYWHFLDAVWLTMFVVFNLTS
jgi:cytochrome c oxidase subunit 3